MDHEEPLLNLSDVVHDEPMDDEDASISPVEPHSPSPPFSSSSPLHDSFADAPHSVHHFGTAEPFSVEMLEREIATLLNQNASAATAALLNAAAQQRQANLEQVNGQGTDGDRANSHVDLSGLALVLQAAHAQATENERLAEALASKDPAFAKQREAAFARQSAEKEKQTTRTAPSFHSLTAGEVTESESRQRKKGSGKKGSDGSDYLYTDEEEESDGDEDGDGAPKTSKRQQTPPRTPRGRTADISSGGSPPVPGEFSDISDILNHLSAQFEPDSGGHAPSLTPDSSIVSHADSSRLPLPITSTPVSSATTLAPSKHHHHPQPIASTSSEFDSAKGKKGKNGKDKGPPLHVCEHAECEKSFTRKSDLARHMRIHTGERPFVCSFGGCGKTFIQRSALHVHSRVHTGEKPHCCEYPGCAKTFGDSSSLARHRRTHTGKRPYKCEDPECEKTFTRRTTLTAHMRTHDPTWEADPNIKYNFKAKKRKVGDADEELEESVRRISALFTQGDGSGAENQPLDAQVATISAEIAAAIAQVHAHARVFDEEEEEGEEDESGSGGEIGPGGEMMESDSRAVGGGVVVIGKDGIEARLFDEEDEDDDSDAFPIPLRTRKGKEPVAIIGGKRKR